MSRFKFKLYLIGEIGELLVINVKVVNEVLFPYNGLGAAHADDE